MALVTNTQVKTYMGVTTSDDDALITTLIAAAEAAIARYCNRGELESSGQMSETHDGNGTASIFVNSPPIQSLSSVVIIDNNGTSTTVDATSYRTDDSTGEIFLLGSHVSRGGSLSGYWPDTHSTGPAEFRATSPRWPVGFQNITVTYTGGWDDGDEPADLEQAIIELTAIMYRESKRDGLLNSETLGDYSYTLSDQDERDEKVRRLLYPFVRWAGAL